MRQLADPKCNAFMLFALSYYTTVSEDYKVHYYIECISNLLLIHDSSVRDYLLHVVCSVSYTTYIHT